MIVLGVDPGSVRTGWAVVEGDGSRADMVEAAVISIPRSLSFPRRLAALESSFREVLRNHAPDVAVVESPFHGVNARSALQLAHSRGVLLAALGRDGIPVEEYPPATIKKTVTGSGRADKTQVRRMVQALLRVGPGDATSDLYDALAAAYCHLVHSGFRSAVRRSGG